MEKKEWQKNFEDTIVLMMGRIHLRARDVIEELVPMVELELDKAREEKIQNIFTREEWGLMYESLIYRFGNDKEFKHLEQKILGMRKLSKLKDNK